MGNVSTGLYLFILVFNIGLSLLVLPRYKEKWAAFRNTPMAGRLIAAGFAVVGLWVFLLYQTFVIFF
ncbi:hypothetical protein [Brevibacillus brevis]|uniref:Uncharacterized protein n=1 Tax=Brevibacillus brevis TaxID=1393 RepID=A0ABY9T6K5_BREBE|nr:hypothetical protein [Brevibacillus brevis]WNC15529.1 hypothetical protein RGB73_04090 [Brevibacillus brevis]